MPPKLRDAYAKMLPRLQAERELRFFNAVAAAAGPMKKADRQAYVRQLVREARAARLRRPASDAEVEALGIKVKRG